MSDILKEFIIDNRKEYVASVLDCRTRLEQLAEEATELAQAALKCIRAEELSNNVTPISARQAAANLQEEFSDVLAVAELLGLANRQDPAKWERWAERLAGRSGETGQGETYARTTDIFAHKQRLFVCSHCGEEILDPKKYCTACGHYLAEVERK